MLIDTLRRDSWRCCDSMGSCPITATFLPTEVRFLLPPPPFGLVLSISPDLQILVLNERKLLEIPGINSIVRTALQTSLLATNPPALNVTAMPTPKVYQSNISLLWWNDYIATDFSRMLKESYRLTVTKFTLFPEVL